MAFEAHFKADMLVDAHKNRLRVLQTVRTRKPQVSMLPSATAPRKDQAEARVAAIWQTVQAVPRASSPAPRSTRL